MNDIDNNDRFGDLNIRKLDIVRSQNAGAIQAGSANANLTVPYIRSRRILPVPKSELLANSAIAEQQNPGLLKFQSLNTTALILRIVN